MSCQRVLVEWALSIVLAVFKAKGDIMNCSCYRALELREHDMVMEKMYVVTVNEMKYIYA